MEVGRKLLGLSQARIVIKPVSRNEVSSRCEKTVLLGSDWLLEKHKEANMLLNKQSHAFIQLKNLGNVKPGCTCCALFAFGNTFL